MKRYAVVALLAAATAAAAASDVFIRYNYLGYNPARAKKVIVMAERNIDNQKWAVRDTQSKIVLQGTLGKSLCGRGEHAPLPFNYSINLSALTSEGVYSLETKGADNAKIIVKKNPYTRMIEKPIRWLRVARSGSKDCLDHAPGHFGDTSCVVYHRRDGRNDLWDVKTSKKINIIGGWNDAADYLKITLEIGYADYWLLRAYAMAPEIFAKKYSTSDYVDVLDEAKFGLDFLARCMPDTNEFVIQVGDNTDHNQGCRLPADDTLDGKRPVLSALSQPQMGYAAASLALGSAIFGSLGNEKLAQHYREMAELIFRRAVSSDVVAPAWLAIPDEGFEFYNDATPDDNMELAAAELYRLTKDQKYLDAGKKFADRARSAGWRAWESVNMPAHLRLIDYYPEVKYDLRSDLDDFQTYSRRRGNLWGVPMKYVWGGLYCYIGVGSSAIEYQMVTKDPRYQSLGLNMIDYLFGCNNWGMFFIASKDIPQSIKHPNSTIYMLQSSRLFPEGAIAEGPGDIKEFTKEYPMFGYDKRAEPTDKFNTEQGVFYDNNKDYMCMETTIGGVADGIYMIAIASRYCKD
jgi:endoglucanase